MDEIRFCLPDIHIGKSLEDWMSSHHISQLKLAKLLDIPQSSLSRLFKSKTINTLKLTKISQALKYNFFKQFCDITETTHQSQFDMPVVNIGKVIDDYMHSKKISRKELAEKLGVDSSGITKVLNKKSIDTGKLLDISYALEYNFFKSFCRSEYEMALDKLLGDIQITQSGEATDSKNTKPDIVDFLINYPVHVPLKDHPDIESYFRELLQSNEELSKENRELKKENAMLKAEIRKLKQP